LAGPFVHIATYAIGEGKLEGLKQFLPELFEIIEANEPHLLAANAFVNEDGTEATFIELHPDAASMEHHARVAHEHTARAFARFVSATTGIQIYGEPSDVILKRARQHAASGVPVIVKPEHLGGFTRLPEPPAEPTSRDPVDRATQGQRHERSAGRQHG
jgi:hypothetical protein